MIKNILTNRKNLKLILALEGVCVGVIVSLIIVIFRLSISYLNEKLLFLYSLIHGLNFYFYILLSLSLIAAYLSSRLLKYEPLISGSGIPQVQAELMGEIDSKWPRVLIAKLISGLISLGFGLTLGREGPSIQLGALGGKLFAKVFKRPLIEHKYLISSGAAAGLGAAFNAPMSGIIFALEEAHRSFSSLALLSAMGSAVTADYISKSLLGIEAVFDFEHIKALELDNYWILIILSLLLSLSALIFNKGILFSKALYDKLKLPDFLKKSLPFLLTFILSLEFTELFGSGHELIELKSQYIDRPYYILFLIVLKLFLLFIAFGSGLSGGIFFPLLVIGSLVGQFLAVLFLNMGLISREQILYIVILAMCAHFTAIVRAPVTGILLICELTFSFKFLLPLTLVAMLSYIFSEILANEPIYESLLHLILKNKNLQDSLNPKKEVYVSDYDESETIVCEYFIDFNSKADGLRISDLRWPKNILLVSIKRQGKELIPNGNHVLKGGDYILILSEEKNYYRINNQMLKICKVG